MSISVKEDNEGFQDQVIAISRVAKVVKGGRRFSFSALVVVGNEKDKIGFGVGKAGEVPDAIKKASEQAKKNMVHIEKWEGTIPFEVEGRFGSSLVQMMPAKSGKGLIAGGPVRIIVELAGITDIVCKIHGSKNGHNVVRATMDGLSQLVTIHQYAAKLGRSATQVQQIRMSKQLKADV